MTSGEPPVPAHRTVAAFFMLGDMTIQRMDNVAIVVDDLDAAVAFFAERAWRDASPRGPA